MTLRLRWTRRALARLDQIGAYIDMHDKAAAGRVVERITSATARLADYPSLGRQGRIAGTRELPFADIPYIIVYRVSDPEVQILTILHTSQKWPAHV